MHARGFVAPVAGGKTHFGTGLSRPEVAHRYGDGARIITRRADCGVPAGHDLLFLMRPWPAATGHCSWATRGPAG